MSEYSQIVTSAEVWAVIRAKHHDQLVVFGSFSNPDGNFNGPSDKGEMFTSYGFVEGSCPLLEARTTWTIDREKPSKRIDEVTEYCLCVAVDSED